MLTTEPPGQGQFDMQNCGENKPGFEKRVLDTFAKIMDLCQPAQSVQADIGLTFCYLGIFCISRHSAFSAYQGTRHNSADSVPTSNLICIKEVAIRTTFCIAGILYLQLSY